MKTREEINDLKAQWLDDPCWDIEGTEGFEEHYKELLDFRLDTEDRWENKRRIELQKIAERLGIPGNTKLAWYIQRSEQRLNQLESKFEDFR